MIALAVALTLPAATLMVVAQLGVGRNPPPRPEGPCDMYAAGGCINDGEPALPIAKISAAASAMPRVYLVRVWDTQLTP